MSDSLAQAFSGSQRICPFCGTLQENHITDLADFSLECSHCHQKTGTLKNQVKALYLMQSLEGLDKKILFSRNFDEMALLSEQVKAKTLHYPVFLSASINKILKKKVDKKPLGKAFFLQILAYFLISGVLTFSINEISRKHIHDVASFEHWKNILFWSPSVSFTVIFLAFLMIHLRKFFFRSVPLLSIITLAILGHTVYTYFV